MPRKYSKLYQWPLLRLVLSLSLSLVVIPTIAAEEETGPLFVKVFAGKSANSYREFKRAVRKNLKAKKAIEEVTTIACDVGKYYGLGVIATAPGKQFLNFETTATWRDLDNYEQPRRFHREYSLRKPEFGTQRFFYEVRANSVDHDMIFVIHIGQQVYLRHKFEIRGCDHGAGASAPD